MYVYVYRDRVYISSYIEDGAIVQGRLTDTKDLHEGGMTVSKKERMQYECMNIVYEYGVCMDVGMHVRVCTWKRKRKIGSSHDSYAHTLIHTYIHPMCIWWAVLMMRS